MRTEKEMFDLILTTALQDDRIRAVYMNGSRTNPNVQHDLFQDYDIVYVVKETASFYTDRHWIDRFGERLYMQYPDDTDPALGYDGDPQQCYGWLIQFTDGNRLDLHVVTESYAKADVLSDQLCKILLDKDHILPAIPEASDRTHWVKKPSEGEFRCRCNEFWWCLNNVAKGLWREEVPYVQEMLNDVIRPQLIAVLSWLIGIQTNFTVSVGKSGKYLYRYLPVKQWNMLLKTYAPGEVDAIWDAVLVMCDLFDHAAKEVGAALGYIYDSEEAANSRGYLEHVRLLPKNAESIY